MKKDDFELPALEYCTLERATRIIGSGCEVEDILHWAEIGAIKLATKFSGNEEYSSTIFFSGDAMLAAKLLLETGQIKNFYINISKFSIFSTSDLVECETVDEILSVSTKYTDNFKLNGYLRGIWNICDFFIDNSRKKQFRKLMFSSLGESDFNVTGCIPEEIGFSESDLIISRKNIEIILGRELRVLPFDGSKLVITKNNDENTSERIAYNRAALIKAFIAVHYGEDVALKPRTFFDNSESEIRKDFESKGIKLPSGKTIESWLKDVEIDFT